MPVYERATTIGAPFEEVWRFHSTVEGLVAVTPGWMELRVEAVTGPAGEPTEELVAGSTLRLSLRPFGVGPRLPWEARVVAREHDGDSASFRDVMVTGPFPRWVHTHRFRAVDGVTRLSDRVEYELPLLGGLSGIGRPFLELMFARRHRRTRALLEGA